MRMGWRFWGLASAAIVGLAMLGCTSVLPSVDMDPSLGPAPPPPLLGAFGADPPVETRAEWERRAPLLREALSEHVYGPMPAPITPRVLAREEIAYPPLAGKARIEQWSVAVTDDPEPLLFNMVLVLPDTPGPHPIIVMENFCGNRASFRDPPEAVAGPLTEVLWACDAEWMAPVIEIPLGRHISVPPYEDILARGYGLAMFYAGDVVADEAVGAREGLARLYGNDAQHAGAIAVWAWLYSRAVDVLGEDARVDAARIAIWGHSRNGKSALLAAAHDPRIAAVIAHQSGRGGASLQRSEAGESVSEMMDAYGYWFPPAFKTIPEDPAIDQHQLLALIAPRPVLLGNGARDAWADPHGAWRAAQAASPAYGLYDVKGLAQDQMRTPNLAANLAFYTRPGLHGVTTQDWKVFLDFLDAHLGAAP
jgi:dienelactone hydrolase